MRLPNHHPPTIAKPHIIPSIMALVCAFALPCASTSVTVTPSPYSPPQYFNASGQPLASGVICTYQAGTTTPIAVYTDHTGTTQYPVCASSGPNPPSAPGIVLNSGGYPSVSSTTDGIWLAVGVGYKLVAYDSQGNLQWTIDGIISPPSLPAGSDTQVQFNDNGLMGANSGFTYNYTTDTLYIAHLGVYNAFGSIMGTLTDCGGQVYNVVCFGADATGAVDSTTAINNACVAAGVGGTVLLPAGTFKVSTSLICNYINFEGTSSANGPSGPNGTVLNWTSSGDGPVLIENGNGAGSTDLTDRGTVIGGFNIENTGGASALVGIDIDNMQGVHIDHFNMVTTAGYCIELVSSIQVERTSIGPDVHLECGDGTSTNTGGGGDVGFVTTAGGGSFENTKFEGPKLDGHAIDVGSGSTLYGSDLSWFGNAGTSTLMTINGVFVNSNVFMNVDGGGSTCHPYYLGANAIVALRAFYAPRNCTGASTLSSGAQFNVYQAGYSTDAGSMAQWNGGGSYDSTSGTYTTYIGSADRSDTPGGGTNAFGLYSNPSGAYSGAWLWSTSATHPNINGLVLKAGSGTISGSTVEASLMMDGTAYLAPQIFSNLTTYEACASGTKGRTAVVTDSTTNTWGATISGSGSDVVFAFCDGSNWTVMGK
jgi:hypothetical protein